MNTIAPYDLAPLLRLLLLGGLIALGPVAWLWQRHRRGERTAWLRALTLFTLFLTFDLVLFGAFTRLSDSGLGCPDWPGCYGSASPLGAHGDIAAAQSAMPTGPVTHGKAWIEMVHRYLATAVGALITVLAVGSAWQRWGRRAGTRSADARLPVVSPWWPIATLAWVCVQGAFGALTVTLKLYPAIVTAHLLGGLGLLMLLARQAVAWQPVAKVAMALPGSLRLGVSAVLVLALLQVTLGGWVSTNYAVLACRDFPTCQGEWWPPMDFDHGFTVMRALGSGRDGGYLPFAALTAIHMAHRFGAAVVFTAMAVLAWRLHASGGGGRLLGSGGTEAQRWASALAAVGAWQLVSGVSNVVLGWPLAAALAHTGGAAALIVLLTVLLARVRAGRSEHARVRRMLPLALP